MAALSFTCGTFATDETIALAHGFGTDLVTIDSVSGYREEYEAGPDVLTIHCGQEPPLPPCADYNGDGRVTMADILASMRNFAQPKPGGGVYTIVDILQAVRQYGRYC